MKDYSEYELQVLMRFYNSGKKKGYLEILINNGLAMIKPTDSQAVILWGRMSNYLLFPIFRANFPIFNSIRDKARMAHSEYKLMDSFFDL